MFPISDLCESLAFKFPTDPSFDCAEWRVGDTRMGKFAPVSTYPRPVPTVGTAAERNHFLNGHLSRPNHEYWPSTSPKHVVLSRSLGTVTDDS
jgi:hypothetical protein